MKQRNGNRITAVVVTHNRKELLTECLDAILGQTYSVDRILLIDNASTDGTEAFLTEKGYLKQDVIHYVLLGSNTGGAGGFYEGLRLARETDCAWVWVMDDDAIPTPDCLECLLEAREKIGEEVSFLASSVFGPGGEFMNVPRISQTRGSNGYRDWYQHLEHAAVKLEDATFVSLLINSKAIQKCGLPCKDYFIWGDDSEYTMRIIRHYGPAYLIGTSKVCHKRYAARSLSIYEEDKPDRIRMYRYFYRNILINKSLYLGRQEFLQFFRYTIKDSILCLRTSHGMLKARVILSGLWKFITEKKKFKRYIEGEIVK
ncbi:MAG: glycosyltransferase family 2 protein [Clostridiales bacterium]|nr:glycosyltransferase family 2 protein [Clostridiales bacterium]